MVQFAKLAHREDLILFSDSIQISVQAKSELRINKIEDQFSVTERLEDDIGEE